MTEQKPVPIISARGLRRLYELGGEKLWALDGVDLDIMPGEYISIMGPSGSGKSTLFNIIGGLDKPTEGKVLIAGQDLAKMDAYETAWLRSSRIGYVFQTFNLIDVMTALENVMLPMEFAGIDDDVARARATEVLERVGLGHRLDHRPDELSGGQQQRVAIARSLANKPSIILADEPTGNLDLTTGEEIIRLLDEIKKETGVTVVSATHDHKMLAASDRVIHIADGKVERIVARAEMDIAFGTIKAGGKEI